MNTAAATKEDKLLYPITRMFAKMEILDLGFASVLYSILATVFVSGIRYQNLILTVEPIANGYYKGTQNTKAKIHNDSKRTKREIVFFNASKSINVSGYEKRATSSFFVFLRFLVSIDSPIRGHYDDTIHSSIHCFLVELCGKLSAFPVHSESEKEHC